MLSKGLSGITVHSTGTPQNKAVNLDITPQALELVLDALWDAAHVSENEERVASASQYKAMYDDLRVAQALAE